MESSCIKHPSGALMVARAEKVKARVERILREFPSARGDDTLMIFRYLSRYHPECRLSFKQFKSLLFIPAFETMSRRRRELQNEHLELRPTERVIRKRARNEHAHHSYYGTGNMTLQDYEVED